MNMDEYRDKYIELKEKLKQRMNKENYDGKGGGHVLGYYSEEKERRIRLEPELEDRSDVINYLTFETDAGNYVSLYEIPKESIKEKEFTKEVKRRNKERILMIDTIPLFDHFTNKYGDLNDNDTIYIHWDKVARDYKGFYLDKMNTELSILRSGTAIYKRRRYMSWWDYEYDFYNVIKFK